MGRTAVIAGTATAVSGHVAAKQQARYAEQQPAGVPPEEASAPTAEAAPAPAQPDVFDQLKKVGELHQQGILTDEEFAAQKAKLLGA
jgi:hypothetical protein